MIEDLLNVPYYHMVFTLPVELNQLALHKPRLVYNLLFKTAWTIVIGFASNPKYLGAKTGMIAVLHTWGQNLSLHVSVRLPPSFDFVGGALPLGQNFIFYVQRRSCRLYGIPCA